jgi:hypothetical protein
MEWALPVVVLALSVVFGLTKLVRMIGPRGRIIYLYLAIAMVAGGVFLIVKGDSHGYGLLALGSVSVGPITKWLNTRRPDSE